jgi:outer membrane receptor protein involved in Fe transport
MKLSAEGKLRLAAKLAFIAGVGTVAGGAYAQDSTQLQGVQVTGTRIKQANLTSSSSVTLISDKELQLQGTVNVENLLNSVPQTFAGFGTTDSNGATGTATVDLRGLGPQETLVLIDGKRLMPGDPLQSPPSADLNFIPAALVQRVDILSGGASAVYGSDAVAGVVNFVMKKDFQGFQIDSELTRTDHSDGTTYDTTLLWGNNFAGGKGNVTMFAGYTKMDSIKENRRGFSSVALKTNSAGTAHTPYGSGVIPQGRFISYDLYYNSPKNAAGQPLYGYDYVAPAQNSATGAPTAYAGEQFNFSPFNYLQRPAQRYNIGGFAHDEINKHLDVYGSVMFMDNDTVAQVAPSGVFGSVETVPCTNPLLTAAEVQLFCNTPTAQVSPGNATLAVLRRTPEVGPRDNELRHDQLRINAGAKGEIAKDIDYDFSVQRGEVIFQTIATGYTNLNNVANALDVIVGPANLPNGNPNPNAGQPECQVAYTGADTSCVPLNIFTQNSITPAAAKYISGVGEAVAHQTEQVATTDVSADLGSYGVKSPMAKSGLGLAGGFEYRTESLSYSPDANTIAGDLGGVGGPSPAVAGAFNVHEEFLEAQMPIAENMPGAKLLQLDAAYRLSHYTLGGEAHNYKGGLKYAPVNDFLLRASIQRATRAPAVSELFSPQAFGLVGGSDPCAATNLYLANPDGTLSSTLAPGAPTEAQCANTGVTAAQYGTPGTTPGTLRDCLAGQCNVKTGGNLGLDNELSITRSVGVVLTPRVVKNFSVTLDYFDITLRHAIGTLPFATILNECLTNDEFCNDIHRGGTGGLSGDTTGGANFVSGTLINTGLERTKGFDTEWDYRLRLRNIGLGNSGQFVFSYVATYLTNLSDEAAPGTGVYECVGRFGTTCGTPNPRYRHKLRATWDLPNGLTLSGDWRYFGDVALDENTLDPNLTSHKPFDAIDAKIGAKQYFDLSGSYALPITGLNLTLRAGISNLFGQNPPVLNQTIASPPFGNGNTFPNVYDSLGRVMFVGATLGL